MFGGLRFWIQCLCCRIVLIFYFGERNRYQSRESNKAVVEPNFQFPREVEWWVHMVILSGPFYYKSLSEWFAITGCYCRWVLL